MKKLLLSVLFSANMAVAAFAQVGDLWISNGDRKIYGVLSRPVDNRGKHPVAIVSHGFNGSHSFGKSYFGALNALGYQVYTFDFPCSSTIYYDKDGEILYGSYSIDDVAKIVYAAPRFSIEFRVSGDKVEASALDNTYDSEISVWSTLLYGEQSLSITFHLTPGKPMEIEDRKSVV